MTTTAAYVRVSSELQARANGTAAQCTAIQRWCAGEEREIPPERWYEDLAVSGKTMDRPAWARMMAEIRGGLVTTVVLYDLSRAGRTLRGLCAWVEEMVQLNVRVVFLKDGIDIGTAVGRLVVHIMGAIAEYSRTEIIERSRSGIRARTSRGESWGGARVKVNKSGTTKGCAKFSRDELASLARRRAAGERMDALAREAGIPLNHLYAKLKRLKGRDAP